MKPAGQIENGEVRWLRQNQPAEGTILFVEEPTVPEDREPIGYTLQPIYSPRQGMMVTQAFVLCSSCRSAISATGGPKYNAVCLTCLDKLDVFNRLSK